LFQITNPSDGRTLMNSFFRFFRTFALVAIALFAFARSASAAQRSGITIEKQFPFSAMPYTPAYILLEMFDAEEGGNRINGLWIDDWSIDYGFGHYTNNGDYVEGGKIRFAYYDRYLPASIAYADVWVQLSVDGNMIGRREPLDQLIQTPALTERFRSISTFHGAAVLAESSAFRVSSYGTGGAIRITNTSTDSLKYFYVLNYGTPVTNTLAPGAVLNIKSLGGKTIQILLSRKIADATMQEFLFNGFSDGTLVSGLCSYALIDQF
jgi:hypothetical protein